MHGRRFLRATGALLALAAAGNAAPLELAVAGNGAPLMLAVAGNAVPLALAVTGSAVPLALATAGNAAPLDVAGALAKLGAPSADVRDAAERELAEQATLADAPLLAAAVQRGSLEVRARIASALMSDERLFALAAELAAATDAAVARTGSEALAGQAATWLGSSDQEPLPMASIERELRSAFSGRYRLELAGADLETELDRIARLADLRRTDRAAAQRVALVLDPTYDPRSAEPLRGAEALGGEVTGPPEDLVYGAAVTHGALFDVYGWFEGRTWIVVRSESAPLSRTAQSLLGRWVLDVGRPSSPENARASARALAATDWSAALAWLDRRWREKQDAAALDGLVLAAGRGALAPSLASRAGAELLLQRADRALESKPPARESAAEAARALLTLGAQGSAAWGVQVAKSASRAPSRCLRCALVAHARSCPPELAALFEERLLAADASDEERCAEVRALGALGEPRGALHEIPNLSGALEFAVLHGAEREFLGGLRALGTQEPDSWEVGEVVTHRGSDTGTRSPLDPRVQAALCADALARGADRVAGRRVATLLAVPGGEELALALLGRAALETPPERLRSGLLAANAARIGDPAAAVARLLACLGLDTDAEQGALADEVFAKAEWTPADWRAAGAVIAHAGGALDAWPTKPAPNDAHYAAFLSRLEQVRTALPAASASGAPGASATPKELQGMDAGWVQGIARACLLLRARECEPGMRELLRRVRVLLQRADHPLRLELNAGRFPPLPPAFVVDLAEREPWLGF